jgi:hypothetical protein
MNDLSLSVFTVEIDRVPTYAIQGRKQAEAEVILADETVREQLRRMTSGGKPLCDDYSIFRMRSRLTSPRPRATSRFLRLFYIEAKWLNSPN